MFVYEAQSLYLTCNLICFWFIQLYWIYWSGSSIKMLFCLIHVFNKLYSEFLSNSRLDKGRTSYKTECLCTVWCWYFIRVKSNVVERTTYLNPQTGNLQSYLIMICNCQLLYFIDDCFHLSSPYRHRGLCNWA